MGVLYLGEQQISPAIVVDKTKVYRTQISVPSKVASIELTYDLPSVPKKIILTKQYTQSADNEVILYVFLEHPPIIGNVGGAHIETTYTRMFWENRTADNYSSIFAYDDNPPTSKKKILNARNSLYGFIGTYDIEIYYE